MEPGDFVEPEIAVTAAVTAALFSPRARKVIRKGLVYGMAGILTAGDTISSFAKSVGQGMQQASASMASEERRTQQANTPMESSGHNQEIEATQ
ncbi:MAG TPA: hypothetical protein VH164_01045 [Ktedonobacteraceae bacterium]|jgi:hypothetical protein|nr:hypothetical protein [Ktedonobacteraceae bacterium]